MKLSGCTGQPGTHTIGRARLRLPVPAEVVRAGPWRRSGCPPSRGCRRTWRRCPIATTRPGVRREPIDPVARRDRLARARVGAEARKAALLVESSRSGSSPRRPARTGAATRPARLARTARGTRSPVSYASSGMVQVDLGQAGQRAEQDVFDARLRRGRDRDGVAVAAQAGGDPQHVHLRHAGRSRRTRVLVSSWSPPSASADPRQLLARQHGDDPLAADPRAQVTTSCGLCHHLADDRGVASERVRAHGRRARVSALCRGTIATSLPSFATYSGSSPSSSHAPRHRSAQRDRRSSSTMPTRGRAPRSRSARSPAPPRVGIAHAADLGSTTLEHGAHQRPCSGALSLCSAVSSSMPSRTASTAMPWSPIVPDTMTTSPGRAALAESSTPGRHHSRRPWW